MVGSFQMVFCQKLPDDGSGGYGSPFVECVCVLEAVCYAVSGGAVTGRGAASTVLEDGRSPALPGVNGEDKGACCTGSRVSNSCLRPCEGRRWLRGVFRDKVGRLGSGSELAVEQGGERECSALFGVDGVVA